MKKNWKVWLYVLEVLVILAVVMYLAIVKIMPEYQKSLGSSERLFSASNYKTGVEINITTGPAFFLIINKKNEVTNIFIENEQAGVITNQNIEGKTINEAVPEIFQKLIDASLIENQTIKAINYNDQQVFNEVTSLMKATLEENLKANQIIKSKSSLQEKAIELKLEETKDSEILWSLYLNSLDIIDRLPKTITNTTPKISINKESASTYADAIYQKLITYMLNADVKNQEINNPTMPIQYIPGDSANTVYASSDSWYYIENYKVYAQITIRGEESYTFCYKGTNTDKKEGICS